MPFMLFIIIPTQKNAHSCIQCSSLPVLHQNHNFFFSYLWLKAYALFLCEIVYLRFRKCIKVNTFQYKMFVCVCHNILFLISFKLLKLHSISKCKIELYEEFNFNPYRSIIKLISYGILEFKSCSSY